MNLCTKDEVAHQLKSSKRTIDNWVANGSMPKPMHIGRRALWAQDSIDSWLSEKATNQLSRSTPQPMRGRPRKHVSAANLKSAISNGIQS
jgi:excisionase family DNA binding protein